MRPALSGVLALASGLTAVVAALLSLPTDGMTPPMGMEPASPLPAYGLLAFGALIVVNGGLLLARVGIPMRPQGGVMIGYGLLMVLVGALMGFTSTFAMEMAMVSSWLMYVFGGLMVLSGALMLTRPAMDAGGM